MRLIHQNGNGPSNGNAAQPVLPLAVAKIIAASRSSGTLNLGGRGLQCVPSSVYDQEEVLPDASSSDACGNWWEVREREALSKVFERTGKSSYQFISSRAPKQPAGFECGVFLGSRLIWARSDLIWVGCFRPWRAIYSESYLGQAVNDTGRCACACY